CLLEPTAPAATITTSGSIRLTPSELLSPTTAAFQFRRRAHSHGFVFNFRSRRCITSPSTIAFLTTSMETSRTIRLIAGRVEQLVVGLRQRFHEAHGSR